MSNSEVQADPLVMSDNRRSQVVTQGVQRTPNRAMLRAVGFGDSDFAKPIVGAIQVLILTISNAPGERAISLSLSLAEFGFVIAGGLLVVIGRALVDAAKAVEETRGFV